MSEILAVHSRGYGFVPLLQVRCACGREYQTAATVARTRRLTRCIACRGPCGNNRPRGGCKPRDWAAQAAKRKPFRDHAAEYARRKQRGY